MYVVDLYTCTIRPAGKHSRFDEPLSISFVNQVPMRTDLLKCLDSAIYELKSRKNAAMKDEDECLVNQLDQDIAKYEMAVEIIKVDKVMNYKTDTYLAPRSIEYAGVSLGTIIWSVDEVWQ